MLRRFPVIQNTPNCYFKFCGRQETDPCICKKNFTPGYVIINTNQFCFAPKPCSVDLVKQDLFQIIQKNPLQKRNENKALPNVLNTIKILYSFASVLLSKFQKNIFCNKQQINIQSFQKSWYIIILCVNSVCIHKASKHMSNTVNTNSINRTLGTLFKDRSICTVTCYTVIYSLYVIGTIIDWWLYCNI